VEWHSNESLYLPNDVTKVARQRGELFIVSAVEYFFIARNAFPWHRVPDVVIARNGYDSFLVMIAIQNNVSVIDATHTLLAVHQTDIDGNFAGGNNTKHKHFNRKLINKLFKTMLRYHFRKGYTEAAPYETINANNKPEDTMSVVIIKRHFQIQEETKT